MLTQTGDRKCVCHEYAASVLRKIPTLVDIYRNQHDDNSASLNNHPNNKDAIE